MVVRWVLDHGAVALWVEDAPDEIVIHIPSDGSTYAEMLRVGGPVFDKHGITIVPNDSHLRPPPRDNSERN